jgi:uncharacterized membrane protein
MSAQPAVLEMPRWLRAKNVVFAFVGAMALYVVFHNERFLVDAADPNWKHIEPFKWWLLPHATAAACALVLAPLQFSDRLRRRFTMQHRVIGRIYVAGVFIGAPLGVYIQHYEERLGIPASFTVLTAVDAALWTTCTGIAFLFAMRRRISQHRQWMTRSFAVALVFLEGRAISGLGGWDDAPPEVAETIIWSCLAMSLLMADIANQWHESRAGIRPRAPHPRVPA